jgi:predicted permease
VALEFISAGVRLLFVFLMILIVYKGVRQQGREGWFAMPAVVLVSVGLFAQELSALHIPGIWFPFGTGVSRTQFAYAAFFAALFALLLRRLLFFAQRERRSTGSGHFAWSKELTS